MTTGANYDVVIAGGGLAGSLLAWRLRQRRPELSVGLIEGGSQLGGNHTWSFFESDLTAAQNAWIEPLVVHRWPAYDVRFPKRTRTLASGYRTITSDRLAEVVAAALGQAVMVSTRVAEVAETRVQLADQRVLQAACVIDARGERASPHLALGFQKFLGLEVRLTKPHGQSRPIIMDATVAQDDGYRFVYTLPFTDDTILIEDTYYSDGEVMAPAALRARIGAYAASRGWTIAETLREEVGVLPIILAGDMARFLAADQTGAPRIGLGAALFHPTTGYSLPDAIRLADALAALPGPWTTPAVRARVHAHIAQAWGERGMFRLLNRMLFKAGRPERRYTVLERFYSLPNELIASFYAGRLSALHKARILIGKPPVPLRDALSCLSEQRLLTQSKTTLARGN
jgi:lycopene beta-cyclase